MRRVLLSILLLAAWLAAPAPRVRAQTRGETPTEARAERIAEQDTSAYTLPPAKMRMAVALTRIRELFLVGGTAWTFAQLLLILRLKIAVRMRDMAERVSKRLPVQAAVFVLLFLLLTDLLNLPLGIYGHHVGLAYGLSVQGWASWFGDKAKSLGIAWAVGTALVTILFWIIRSSPRRWWLCFWPAAVASVLAGVFATPYVIDPIFNHFDSLSHADPALVERLEQVVARGGLDIPPDRMYVMQASAKYTGLNAYVTGFGASKRIVVWDTTIAKATPDEIAEIFGHEMGHYALGHLVIGTTLGCLGLLPLFWLMYVAVGWLLRRFGRVWGIASQQDLAALVALVLVFDVLTFAAAPITNGVSRSFEHAADVYGQEAVHGIVADPQAVALKSFQVLGEQGLDDPTPHPLLEFWFDDHPPTRTRAAFARAYDPWATGETPRYFPR